MAAATKDPPALTVGLVLVLWTASLFAAVGPAAINGFPLVFSDTNVYISPLSNQWEGTPPFYSAFVFAVAITANLHAVPLVQAACALITIDLALRSLVPRASVISRAAGSCATVTLTQLPWLASWIMPDLFGGLGAIAVIALMIRREPPSLLQGAALSMMAFFSALSATANVLVLIPIAVLCLLLRHFWLGWKMPPKLVLGTVILSSSAIAMPVGWNAIRFDAPRLNVGGGALLFSKLVDAGIAQHYLVENCPHIQHPVCSHLDELYYVPYAQAFLWEGNPTLAEQLNAWHDPDGSFGRLALDIIRSNPLKVVNLTVSDTMQLSRQFILGFKGGLEGGELRPYRSESGTHVKMARFHATLLRNYDSALQQAGDLAKFYSHNFYFISGVLSCSLLMLALPISIMYRQREHVTLIFVFVAVIIVGIVVHGGLVGPYARYNVKFSWLASFALLVLALRQLSSTGRGLKPEKPIVDDGMDGSAKRQRSNCQGRLLQMIFYPNPWQ